MSLWPRYAACALVILFLASVARFYHPGLGFTALLGLPEGHDQEAPALRGIPHADYPARASYDGQFYVQRALDPLVRDPDVDHAMDLAPFRARRILFCWTAYVLGAGRPAWVVEAYALQNVVSWLILAVLLTRWVPPTSGRGLALWSGCLFSHGLLWSVRFSLLDGPSLLLIAAAIAAAERKWWLGSAGIVGLAVLGRETNILAGASQGLPRDRRGWTRLAFAAVLMAVPLLIWYDYLWSIYRSTLLAGTDALVWPFQGLWPVWVERVAALQASSVTVGNVFLLLLVATPVVQAVFLAVHREPAFPWWRVAAAYAVLLLLLGPDLARPTTGAITRVLLPLKVGFNALLARQPSSSGFWPWWVAGNLDLLSIWTVMPLVPL